MWIRFILVAMWVIWQRSSNSFMILPWKSILCMVGFHQYSYLLIFTKVPKSISVDFNTREYYELEEEGLKILQESGFVLVAGGLGERLGYNNIKVSLPVETFSMCSYLEYYISKILAIQVSFKNKCNSQHRIPKEKEHLIPFAIMTSDNNHEMYAFHPFSTVVQWDFWRNMISLVWSASSYLLWNKMLFLLLLIWKVNWQFHLMDISFANHTATAMYTSASIA